LHLDGLTELETEVAEGLGKYKGQFLSLDGLTELSITAAKALAKNKATHFYLNGLTHLSGAVAEALAEYSNKPNQDKAHRIICEIFDGGEDTIEDLHKGGLNLGGLVELSAAEAVKA
jgi:hypothetical protein